MRKPIEEWLHRSLALGLALAGGLAATPTLACDSAPGATQPCLDYVAKIKSDDADPLTTGGISAGYDAFAGISATLAVSGNVLVVGTPGDDSPNGTWADTSSATNSGAVYVIRAPGGNWANYVIDTFLKESSLGSGGTIASGNGYGAAVAFDGATLAVSAPRNSVGAAGKVYVYRVIDTDGTGPAGVTYADTLTDSSTVGLANRQYGFALAINGRNLFVGVPNDNANVESTNGSDNNYSVTKGKNKTDTFYSGAVYVYYDANGDGTGYPPSIPNQKLKHRSDAGAVSATHGMMFGYSMDVDGAALIVGQPGCKSCVPGQAYPADATVFVSSTPGNWAGGTITSRNLRSEIAGDGELLEHLGFSVGIDGDTAVVGAPDESSSVEDTNNIASNRSGAAYVFHAPLGNWSSSTQLRRLKARAGNGSLDPRWLAAFGRAVAIDGHRIAVGADNYDPTSLMNGPGTQEGAGAVYVFEDESPAPFQSGAAIQFSQFIDYRVDGVYEGQGGVACTTLCSGDFLGTPLLLDASRLFIGARGESSTAANVHDDPIAGTTGYQSGSVFLFSE